MFKLEKLFPAFAVFLLLVPAGRPVKAQETTETQPPGYSVILPEGTVIPIILSAYLSTKNSQPGDIVYATTNYPVWYQQKLVIPKGSEIRGTLTDVVRPGRIKGKGRLVVRFDDILLPNGVKRELSASFRGIHGPGDEKLDRKSESVEGGASTGDDAGTIISTTATGTSIGTIAGAASGNFGKGIGIGAGAGAAAGVASVLLSRGKDLILEPGTQFDLELQRPLEFSDYELQFTNSELNDARQSVQTPAPRRTNDSGGNSRRSWPLPGLGIPY